MKKIYLFLGSLLLYSTALCGGIKNDDQGQRLECSGCVGASDIANDSIDGAQIADTITLDAPLVVTGNSMLVSTFSVLNGSATVTFSGDAARIERTAGGAIYTLFGNNATEGFISPGAGSLGLYGGNQRAFQLTTAGVLNGNPDDGDVCDFAWDGTSVNNALHVDVSADSVGLYGANATANTIQLGTTTRLTAGYFSYGNGATVSTLTAVAGDYSLKLSSGINVAAGIINIPSGVGINWTTGLQVSSPSVPLDISCIVQTSSIATISANVLTKLNVENELTDTDNMHSTFTNTQRITFTTAGKYMVWHSGEFTQEDPGRHVARVTLNGTTDILNFEIPLATSGNAQTWYHSREWTFAANDYIELFVFSATCAQADDCKISYSANQLPLFGVRKVDKGG